jgi:hypothetical protein
MNAPQTPDGWSSGSEPDVNESSNLPDGVPPRSRRTRWVVGSLSAAALAAGLVVAGATLAGADSGNPLATATAAAEATPSPKPDVPAAPEVKGFGHGIGGSGLMGALHGQFVVPKSGGGYETVDVQRGKVTAVSKDSLTVASDDGYTKTYTVTADTLVNGGRDGIASIKNSDTVAVLAGDGATPTALHVTDLTTVQGAHERWGFGKGHRPSVG